MTIDPRFLAEVKARVSLVELIGPALQKLQRAGNDWRALCPFHHERHGSFYIVEKKAFWHCFGCGERGDCFSWVMKTTTAREFPEAVEYLAARAGMRANGPQLEAKAIVKRPGQEALAAERERKINGAREIWAMKAEAARSPVASYLRGRGIRLEIPPTIGFVPQLAHPYLRRREVGFPAMVAAVQSGDRKIVGAHCTYLGAGPRPGEWVKMPPPTGWPEGEDWKPKIMRGTCWGGAVRLTPVEDVIVLAEGIETSLSVLQALYDDEVRAPHIDGEPVAVWAALSLGNLGAVELPKGVREIILAADADGKAPAAGSNQKDPEEILEQAAERHREAGRNVRIARPPAGRDFNDMLAPGAGAS